MNFQRSSKINRENYFCGCKKLPQAKNMKTTFSISFLMPQKKLMKAFKKSLKIFKNWTKDLFLVIISGLFAKLDILFFKKNHVCEYHV